jgi:NADPH:quinone reductase-like Zn-dependent oxidoreductase
MQTNKALRIHAYGGPEITQIDEIAMPTVNPGQILVAVKVAGINPLDWKIRDGLVRDAFPLPLPAVLGLEFAGVVSAVSDGVTRVKVGDRIMGFLGRPGAYAHFIAADEAKLCLTPDGLTDVEAAALPVASLTAWQMLRAAGELRRGQKVLIHGASGGVGGFAVQFAKAAGAVVSATASAGSLEHVRSLGADRVIDRHGERFEAVVGTVDLVLDLVGGETLDRSWAVLASGGTIVSIAAPDIAARTPPGRNGLWFQTTPDRERLHAIAETVARGEIRSTIAEVVEFAKLADAIERSKTGHAPGKTVVMI